VLRQALASLGEFSRMEGGTGGAGGLGHGVGIVEGEPLNALAGEGLGTRRDHARVCRY